MTDKQYPELPEPTAWRTYDNLLKRARYNAMPITSMQPGIYSHTRMFTEDQMYAYVDADRAMRAQAAPAAVASPLTKLQRKAIAVCFTSDKVSVSEVQRKLSISYADAQTLCQSIVDLGLTDELELAPSLKRGAPAPHPAPVAQGDALPREEFAWMVVQEACETEPADEDDPECIRILRRDLKSAVLAAFLREDAARAQQEHKP